MTPIKNCIVNKDTTRNPIWLMRQAGRYLPEFREIRKENQDFIKLCLNSNLSSEITLQPIKRCCYIFRYFNVSIRTWAKSRI